MFLKFLFSQKKCCIGAQLSPLFVAHQTVGTLPSGQQKFDYIFKRNSPLFSKKMFNIKVDNYSFIIHSHLLKAACQFQSPCGNPFVSFPMTTAGWICSVLGRWAHEAVTYLHLVQTIVEKHATSIKYQITNAMFFIHNNIFNKAN